MQIDEEKTGQFQRGKDEGRRPPNKSEKLGGCPESEHFRLNIVNFRGAQLKN